MGNQRAGLLGVLFSLALSQGAGHAGLLEIAGGAFQITRSEVGPAGGILTGGNGPSAYFMTSSAGGVGSGVFTDPNNSSQQLQAGLSPLLPYPDTVTDLVATATSTAVGDPAFLLNWTAPRAGIVRSTSAASYDIRYAKGPTLNENSFNAGIVLAQSLAPKFGGTETVLLGDTPPLTPDTIYTVGLRSLGREGNLSYLSTPTATLVTLTVPPSNLTPTYNFSNTVTLTFNTNLSSPKPYDFEAQASPVSDYSSGKVMGFSVITGGAGGTGSIVFPGQLSGDYYFRVRSKNSLGVDGPWSAPIPPIKVGNTGQGIPTYVSTDTLQVIWSIGGAGSFEGELSTDSSFTVSQKKSLVIGNGVAAGLFSSLASNTTYYFRLLSTTGGTSTPFQTDSIVTMVHRAPSANVLSVATGSATVGWTAPTSGSGGPENFPYSYRLEATDIPNNYAAPVSSAVSQSVLSAVLTGLTPNTTYYPRLATLNAAGVSAGIQIVDPDPSKPPFTPLIQPDYTPVDFGSLTTFTTLPNPPAGTNYILHSSSLTVTWASNNNPPATTNYLIEASTGAFSPSDTVSVFVPGALSGTLKGLMANGVYNVRMRTKGLAADSAVVTVGANLVTRPAPVANVTLPVNANTVTVNWSSGSATTGFNAPLTSYKVELLDGSGRPIGSPQTVTGLTVNFSYSGANPPQKVKISALSTGNLWPPAVYIGDLLPAPAAASLSALSDTSVFVGWTSVSAASSYAVDASTSVTFSPLWGPTQTTANTTFLYTGLLPDTTFYFRVASVLNGQAGIPGFMGGVSTKPSTATVAGFAVDTTSVTVSWTSANPAGTFYQVRRDGVNGVTSPLVTGTRWTDTGLSTNTAHAYEVRAISRNLPNDPAYQTPYSQAVSTFTLASTPPKPSGAPYPIVLGPDSLKIKILGGDNPSGTEFALRIALNSGGALQGAYFAPTGTGTGTFQLAGPVWQSLTQWGGNNAAEGPNGFAIVTATGLVTGVNYDFIVYARNGDTVVTSPSPSRPGLIQSGVPLLGLNGITTAVSAGTEVWRNALLLPFTAAGSFFYEAYLDAIPDDPASRFHQNTPGAVGWDGSYAPTAPVSTDSAVNSSYTGPLSGFVIPGEGTWYLHIFGHDGPIKSFTGPVYGPDFRVFVDTSAPAVSGLTAQFSPTDATVITAGVATPNYTPYFTWNGLNATGTPGTDSPLAGYSYSFSTSAGQQPVLSTDTAVNPNSIPATVSAVGLALNGSQRLVPAVYYFRVQAVDTAGNWGAPVSFTYTYVPDFSNPTVSQVSFSRSAPLPAGQNLSVAVATDTWVRVDFSKPVSGANTGLFTLKAVRDNLGQTLNAAVTISSLQLDPAKQRVELTLPPLSLGHTYELTVSGSIQDTRGNLMGTDMVYRFVTVMDPGVANAVISPDGSARVTFAPGAFGTGPAGLAINDTPQTQPMRAASLADQITQANDAVRRARGPLVKPLAIKEFNLAAADGTLLPGDLPGGAVLTFNYPDADGDGVVDGTSGAPLFVKDLTVSWLDPVTGVWVKVPGSEVDLAARTVSAAVSHFSVYAVIGTPSTDLSTARAYPVPYRASLNPNGITFTDLSSQATVKIYTLDGRLVKTLTGPSGVPFTLRWNPVANDRGEPAASDVYIYVIENSEQKKIGKLMVIR
jgi:hypothetical protein